MNRDRTHIDVTCNAIKECSCIFNHQKKRNDVLLHEPNYNFSEFKDKIKTDATVKQLHIHRWNDNFGGILNLVELVSLLNENTSIYKFGLYEIQPSNELPDVFAKVIKNNKTITSMVVSINDCSNCEMIVDALSTNHTLTSVSLNTRSYCCKINNVNIIPKIVQLIRTNNVLQELHFPILIFDSYELDDILDALIFNTSLFVLDVKLDNPSDTRLQFYLSINQYYTKSNTKKKLQSFFHGVKDNQWNDMFTFLYPRIVAAIKRDIVDTQIKNEV